MEMEMEISIWRRYDTMRCDAIRVGVKKGRHSGCPLLLPTHSVALSRFAARLETLGVGWRCAHRDG